MPIQIRLSLALLVGCLCFDAVGQSPSPVLHEGFDMQVPVAPEPVVIDGRTLLYHELHLTNFTEQALDLARVDVVDATDGRALARFEGEALEARIGLPGERGHPPQTANAPGRRGVVYLDFEVPAAAPPEALRHRVVYRGTRGDEVFEDVVLSPVVEVEQRPPLVLAPPLRGGPWAVLHSPDWARGHRRVFYAVEGRARLPGRFATDWILLDADGRDVGEGDPDLVRSALGYGADVLAVADATVAAVRDGYPEAERLSENRRHALADASGNHVVLDLGHGRYAIYEHLRPGSIRVAKGQRVRTGEVVGELGLSGDGSQPHLHFHVADGPHPLLSEGRPFVLSGFRVLGDYADTADIGRAPWSPADAGDAATRADMLPAGNSVVDFDLE